MSKPDRFSKDDELTAHGLVHIEHIGYGEWSITTPNGLYRLKGAKLRDMDEPTTFWKPEREKR